MKLEVTRRGFVIKPEGELDEAYIEDTLGLYHDGDYVMLRRENKAGSSLTLHRLVAKKMAFDEV